MTLRAIFSWKWIIPTILVVLGMIGLARLGIWQLDRLQQKQSYNTLVSERWRSDPYDLNANRLPDDLTSLEYRRVSAQGAFDYEHQMLVQGSGGYFVITPLLLGDDRAVLVARGWIPTDLAEPAQLAALTEPADAPILGLARKSQTLPNSQVSAPVTEPQQVWYRVDIPAMQGQVPYQLEPGFIELLPGADRSPSQFPQRENPPPLDEGNHLGYAIQWFTFALVLGFGYIMLVRHRTRLAAGLIQSPPLAPPMPEPGAEPAQEQALAQDAAPVAATPAQADDPGAGEPAAAQPEPVLAGEQPRP